MLVNENLPSVSESEAASLTPNAQLVLLVPDLGDTDVARGVLRKFDFDYTPREQMQFGSAGALLLGRCRRFVANQESRPVKTRQSLLDQRSLTGHRDDVLLLFA